MEKRVLICVCTYNRAISLKRCIESLLKLNYNNFQVVVVDNNSSDATKDIIKEFPQVKYLLEEKQGVAFARNCFLNYCKKEKNVSYIAFIDDDETVPKFWIAKMLDCMNCNSRLAVVCGPCIPVYFEQEAPNWLPDGLHNANEHRKDVNAIFTKMDVLTGNCFIDYNIIEKENICFNNNLGRKGNKTLGGEDTDFFFRLVDNKYLYVFTSKAPIYHWIEKERLTFKYCVKRYFFEGVSEYCRKNKLIIYKSIPKLFIQSIHFVVSFLSLNKKYIVIRFLKLVKTSGIIMGIYYTKSKL